MSFTSLIRPCTFIKHPTCACVAASPAVAHRNCVGAGIKANRSFQHEEHETNMRRTCFNHSETHKKIVASQGEAGLTNISWHLFSRLVVPPRG